jgi:hypothetical protein
MPFDEIVIDPGLRGPAPERRLPNALLGEVGISRPGELLGGLRIVIVGSGPAALAALVSSASGTVATSGAISSSRRVRLFIDEFLRAPG